MLIDPPNDNLLLRTALAATLVQVYRVCPTAPRLPGTEVKITEILVTGQGGHDLALKLLQVAFV